MGIITITLLFGILLGHFFKWTVLFPTALLIMIAVLGTRAPTHSWLQGSFLQSVLSLMTLQFGYVMGLVANTFLHSASKASAAVAGHLGELASGGNDGLDQVKAAEHAD